MSKFLKTYIEISKYIPDIQRHADNNKKPFGFLQSSAYEDMAIKNQIWISISEPEGSMEGYLIFGGTYPKLKIFQLFVVPDCRGKGIAQALLKEFIDYGESHHYSTIEAKVAAELEANKFWENEKFFIYKQEQGGTCKSVKRRMINHRVFFLNTHDLLSSCNSSSEPTLAYPESTLFRIPVYAIDLNYLFDITKDRKDADEANLILNQGLNGYIKLCITPEFKKELERNSYDIQNDPILKIASSLPVLSECEDKELHDICIQLREIIFPKKPLTGAKSANEASDLNHLAYCCVHKINGFITRDKALLIKASHISNIFGISIISPTEIDRSITLDSELSIRVSENTIQFRPFTIDKKNQLIDFLNELGLTKTQIESLNRKIIADQDLSKTVIYKNDYIIGYSCWNIPSRLNKQIDFYLYIDESQNGALNGIEHIIESITRELPYQETCRIDMHILKHQRITKNTAISRGFLSNTEKHLIKISYNGFINKNNWDVFKNNFFRMSDKQIPDSIPPKKDILNTGITIKSTDDLFNKCLSLFSFETLISPGIILYEDRECLLLPIRENYATELLGELRGQLSLLPSEQTSLLLEKAYFRTPSRLNYFKKGKIIAFYVSGNKSIQEIVGLARITFSDVLTLEQINHELHRQGVLKTDELNDIANQNNELHVITFDNFKKLPKRISFKMAKEKGIISKANLATVQKISHEKFISLLEESYPL